VGWRYREFVDPFQRVPGVGPLEGAAEALVRGGRITLLTLVVSPASVQRQQGELDAAGARAMATRRAAPLGDGPSDQPRRGEFQGLPPTGREIRMRGIDFFRLADGKLAEGWIDYDVLGMLQQMGAVVAPAGAAGAGAAG
jgi:hypothetical protein